MELSKDWQEIIIETGQELKGYARRIFQAKIVKVLGKGGQRQAEKELKWNRGTIRKGLTELEGKFGYIDQFRKRGRKRSEAHLPNLLSDIQEIAERASQTDPTFQTTQLYIRLSAAEVRKQLLIEKGYQDEELPCVKSIGHKLDELGYSLKKVQKSQPLKKKPETDAIFERLGQVNPAADKDETVLRLSVDAKGAIPLGEFSRGGYNRVPVKALDHDFRPDQKVTPVGVFLPQYNETYIFLTTSSVTSDLIVDCIEAVWRLNEARFPLVNTLLLNQDNGPECHSRRTQFMKRIADLADHTQRTIDLEGVLKVM